MKLTCLFLLVACITSSANGYSQVTLSENEVPLQQVFRKIRQQTGYDFLYSDALVQQAGKVSVNVQNVSLDLALRACLRDKPLSYRIIDRTIVITEKYLSPVSPPPIIEESVYGEVTGIVTDEKSAPIPGVTVYSRATHEVTVTSDAGNFRFANLNEGDTLVFTSVNYEPLNLRVNTRKVMNVVMKLKVTAIEGITIYNTGYQKIDKERATGSFSKPDMKVYSKRVSSQDVLSRLEGQIPGLQLAMGPPEESSNPGTFYTSSLVRKSTIRGKGSVSSDTNPLYVVNGVIVSDFSAINIDDIEDITVLKDAAAAAIWGARAANGVIVVNTKSGKRNQKLTVSYNSNINYTGKPDFDYVKYLSSAQYIQAAKELFDPVTFQWSSLTDGSNVIAPHDQILYDQYRGLISQAEADRKLDSLSAIDANPQFRDLFFRPAFTTNHTVSLSGGNANYSFYASLGYIGAQSSVPGETNNSYKFNVTQNVAFKDRFRLTLNTGLASYLQKSRNYAVGTASLPYQMFRDQDGNNLAMDYFNMYNDSVTADYEARSRLNLGFVPLDEVNYADSKTSVTSINLTATAELKLWKGLSFIGTYSYQKRLENQVGYVDNKTWSGRRNILRVTVAPTPNDIPVYYLPVDGGTLKTNDEDGRTWTVRNQLAYTASPRNGKDNLSIQVGQEANETSGSYELDTKYGYSKESGAATQLDNVSLNRGIPDAIPGYGFAFLDPGIYRRDYSRFISYFALASYTYDQKYSVDLSWRQDQSSLFGTDISSQNKPVWSFGARWQLNKEKFITPLKWISELGLRATYGIQGNSPYLGPSTASSNDIVTIVNPNYFFGALGGPSLNLSSPGNKKLSWESVATVNLGVDYGLFDNRVTGSLNFYRRTSTDMLGQAPGNPLAGFQFYYGNIGKLRNTGVELLLNTENIRGKTFGWSTTFTFSKNNNKLLSYNDANIAFRIADAWVRGGALAGYPLDNLFAYQFAGLDNLGDPQIYLSDKTITKQPNTANVEDLKYMGVRTPPITTGLSNTFRYKSLELTLNMVGYFGGIMRRDVLTTSSFAFMGRFQTVGFSYDGNMEASFADRWKQPGDETKTNIPSWVNDFLTGATRRNLGYYTYGDINVVSSDYVKLRDITLNFTLPENITQRLGLQQFNIFVQAGNYMVWKANKVGMDPEWANSTQVRQVPPYKHTYAAGLTLNF